MNNIIKPCPFCGDDNPFMHDIRWTNPNSGYSCTDTTHYAIRCGDCNATGNPILQKTFNEFFENTTVQDYRNNNALRAEHEDEYEGYARAVKQDAVAHWNKRSEILNVPQQPEKD